MIAYMRLVMCRRYALEYGMILTLLIRISLWMVLVAESNWLEILCIHSIDLGFNLNPINTLCIGILDSRGEKKNIQIEKKITIKRAICNVIYCIFLEYSKTPPCSVFFPSSRFSTYICMSLFDWFFVFSIDLGDLMDLLFTNLILYIWALSINNNGNKCLLKDWVLIFITSAMQKSATFNVWHSPDLQ